MLKVTKAAIPPVVSKRNHFAPADEFVEFALPSLPDQYKSENFRGWLLQYTERVISGAAFDFATAAQRGIEQAAKLLCDPEYYATKRERRKREMEQWKQQRAAQQWEQMERRTCPTAEQIAQESSYIETRLAQLPIEKERLERRLAELQEMEPKNIRFRPKAPQ